MSGLFGVDIAGVVNGAFAGQLHVLTLHKITQTIGTYGEPVNTVANHAGEGVRLKWKAETALAKGYPLEAAKILILQNGIVEPIKTDEITIGGQRYRIIDIERDPVNATWVCAAIGIGPTAYTETPPDPSDWQ